MTEMKPFVFTAQVDSARVLANILQTLSFKKDQMVNCQITSAGLKFVVEESRTMVATATIQSELFNEFLYTNEEQDYFSISLSVLLECLNIYTLAGTNQTQSVVVKIGYRGHGSPFLIMLEESGVLTDCALRTLEPDEITHISVRSSDIMAQVIIKSEGLKDAFHELDFGSSCCTWLISDQQPYFRLSTDGSGATCQVDYPKDSDVFQHFEVTGTVEFRYKMKLLQPCVKALASASDSQVRINANGVLSVQHKINSDGGQACFVEFLLMPLLDDDMDE